MVDVISLTVVQISHTTNCVTNLNDLWLRLHMRNHLKMRNCETVRTCETSIISLFIVSLSLIIRFEYSFSVLHL